MLSFRDLVTGLRKLDLPPTSPVIVHASLYAFGQVHGGSEAVVGALLNHFHAIMAPVFTYKTMIIPEVGPEENGITYGSGEKTNRMAEFFHPDMRADRMMGVIPETLRRQARAQRSSHPILSFAGVNTEAILAAQSMEEPLGPIHALRFAQGWVVLLGVDHTVSTSIHYAERVAGRKQFIRWALTPQGVVECPAFPGCSDGFQAVASHLEGIVHATQIGEAAIQAVPVEELTQIVVKLIREDPAALLCSRTDCERCNAVRADQGQAPGT